MNKFISESDRDGLKTKYLPGLAENCARLTAAKFYKQVRVSVQFSYTSNTDNYLINLNTVYRFLKILIQQATLTAIFEN